MTLQAHCFKKERVSPIRNRISKGVKGKYRYHFFVLGLEGREITRFGIESKAKLLKKQLDKRVKIRLKKIQKIIL